MLRRAAATLKSSVRSYDIVGRYGGDEFMIILPATDAGDAAVVASRIVENAMRTRVTIGNRESLTLNFAVGLAVFPDHASTRQELIDAADRAMYQTKHHRRAATTGRRFAPAAGQLHSLGAG